MPLNKYWLADSVIRYRSGPDGEPLEGRKNLNSSRRHLRGAPSLDVSLSLFLLLLPHITCNEPAYLLAAGLSDLFHFVVFALNILGMGLTQTLHLHLQTQLGLKEKNARVKPCTHQGLKEHFADFQMMSIYSIIHRYVHSRCFVLYTANKLCSQWKENREWGWEKCYFLLFCLETSLQLNLLLSLRTDFWYILIHHKILE